MRALPVACLLAWTLTFAACGGSGSPASPSGSSPVPSGSANACTAISGASSPVGIAIFNGASCSTTNASVVLLNLRDKANGAVGSCSGTVIAPRAVLTAAHCLVGDTAIVRVYRGTGLQLDAVSFKAYPDYKEADPAGLDVGVVLTGEDLQRPSLPLLLSRDAKAGEAAIIAGWGLDQNDVGTTLRAGTTTISSVGANFLQTQFASTGAGSGVCGGDSGGPLLVSEGNGWAIAGVTSATGTVGCRDATDYFANLRNPSIRSFVTNLVPDAAVR